MNRSPATRIEILILSVLALLLAGALLLGIAACYVVGSGELLGDLRAGFAYFFFANANLALLEVLLLGLAVRMVYLVLADAVARRRQRWFDGMLLLTLAWVLVLALIVFLPGYVAAVFDSAGTGSPIVVGCGGLPFLLALSGLLYVVKPKRDTRERAHDADALRRVVQALAIGAFLLIGLPGLFSLLYVLPNPFYDYSGPPLYQGIGYLANQAIWQALQLVFIWAVGILTLVDAARRRRWGWLRLLLIPSVVGMAWVGACGILTTWDVAGMLLIPLPLYVASIPAPAGASLLVSLPALIYAGLTAPRSAAAAST